MSEGTIASFSALAAGDQTRIHRFVKRRLRIRMLVVGKTERKKIRTILGDEELFNEFCAQSWSAFGTTDVAPTSDTPFLDKIGQFFQWFVENWDQIQPIIEWLIGIFAGMVLAARIDPDEMFGAMSAIDAKECIDKACRGNDVEVFACGNEFTGEVASFDPVEDDAATSPNEPAESNGESEDAEVEAPGDPPDPS